MEMTRSGDDVRERYQAQLGKEFGAVFHGLWHEWAWSLARRDEFRELFTRAEDVSLLNALTGGGFTWNIQNVLWEDLLLRVCRLTDPQKSAGKDNLTVTRLPAFCERQDPALCDKVRVKVYEAVQKADFARDLEESTHQPFGFGGEPLEEPIPWLQRASRRFRVPWMPYMLS